MSDIEFGKLEDLPLRTAWKHEALSFTPWLAENIDHLSDAIGIPLELTDTEVAVENFAADILARNPMDGSVVLIENQLEKTDHTHLGQIMTYLAGLKAKTIVWISPEFREPHLSAINWLNDNTAEEFAFIAVRLRVVRIGNSPFAPIFEVIAKPSGWERALGAKRRQANKSQDPLSDTRLAFWQHYIDRYPLAAKEGLKATRRWNVYFPYADGDILLSLWIGKQHCGIFIRGGWEAAAGRAHELLSSHVEELASVLGCQIYENGEKQAYFGGEKRPPPYDNPEKWDEIIDWQEERRQAYNTALNAVLDQGSN